MARSLAFHGSWLGLCLVLGASLLPSTDAARAADLIGVETGGTGGITERMAEDLANLVDDGTTRRVVPMIAQNGVQSIADLVEGRNVDMAFLQMDVLDYVKSRALFPDLTGRIGYVTRLNYVEFHLLARSDVTNMADLAGKIVNVGPASGNTAITASQLFKRLDLSTIPGTDKPEVAIGKLRRGEIAAVAFVGGKPAPLLRLTDTGGLHLVPVPLTPEIVEAYVPGKLTASDYPGLIRGNGAVETIAIATGLFVGPAAKDSDRYRKLSGLVDTFFDQFQTLLTPGHQEKWGEVNLASQIQGWQRFPPAAEWLRRGGSPVPEKDPRSISDKMADLQRQLDALKRTRDARVHADEQADAAKDSAGRQQEPPFTPLAQTTPLASRPRIPDPAVGTTPDHEADRPRVAAAAAAAASTTRASPEVVRSLLQRGDAMLEDGDVLSARLFFERAAGAGSGKGALSAGKTYDPNYLASIDATGLKGDPARALEWYHKASALLGDREADDLIRQLGTRKSE